MEALKHEVNPTDRQDAIRRIVADVNATIDDVSGSETADAEDFRIAPNIFQTTRREPNAKVEVFHKGLRRALDLLESAMRRQITADELRRGVIGGKSCGERVGDGAAC